MNEEKILIENVQNMQEFDATVYKSIINMFELEKKSRAEITKQIKHEFLRGDNDPAKVISKYELKKKGFKFRA
jgi:hypothetical protein